MRNVVTPGSHLGPLRSQRRSADEDAIEIAVFVNLGEPPHVSSVNQRFARAREGLKVRPGGPADRPGSAL